MYLGSVLGSKGRYNVVKLRPLGCDVSTGKLSSTCVNHISGSEGQNVGSLRVTVTAEMLAEAGIPDSSAEASPLSTDIASSVSGRRGSPMKQDCITSD